jgi:hypothetical protein
MTIPEPLREFLEGVGKDPIARQALADAIASGAFPKNPDTGTITFTIEGLNWMERREEELRREQN